MALLRELVPAAARVAVLLNPAYSPEATLKDLEQPARAMGMQLQVLNASNSREINAAFDSFERARPDALFVGPGPYCLSRRVQLGPSSDAARRPRGICRTRLCGSRWADELRRELDGGLS